MFLGDINGKRKEKNPGFNGLCHGDVIQFD